MGFLFFKKRKEEANVFHGAAIFEGFTDWHSHILPGVDDGVRTMEESLAILTQYEEWGVNHVWLTPHIMEDMPNETQDLKERFEELKAAYAEDHAARVAAADEKAGDNVEGAAKPVRRNPLQLSLAAENMLDNLFKERLAADDFLPIGPKGDSLLVETSYYNPPMNLYDTLEEIRERGYNPILAHPERYVYMSMRDYDRLKGMGIKFQMNLFSQADRYGRTVHKKLLELLDKHYYNYMGSDIHSMGMLSEVPDIKFRSAYL